jgi:hypothetical protein
MSDWKPINTIPMDGRPVLLRLDGNMEQFSTGSHWRNELKVDLVQYFIVPSSQHEWMRNHPATHWMPIKGPENETL